MLAGLSRHGPTSYLNQDLLGWMGPLAMLGPCHLPWPDVTVGVMSQPASWLTCLGAASPRASRLSPLGLGFPHS